MGRDHEGKRKWLGTQAPYSQALSEAGVVHLVFNPLLGIINQDSHQQMFFDVLHGLDNGVIPFTMRASITMCISFEASIGCKGLTSSRIEKRMHNMASVVNGFIPGQRFHEKFSLMFPLSKHCHCCTSTNTQAKLTAQCVDVTCSCFFWSCNLCYLLECGKQCSNVRSGYFDRV